MLREGDPKVDCVILSRSPDDDVADAGPARRNAAWIPGKPFPTECRL